MPDETLPFAVIENLADAINRHDVDAIMQFLHDGHVFVDSGGNQIQGSAVVRAAWQAYFKRVPDYWLRVDHGVISNDCIALFGHAGGTLAVGGKLREENRWETTAAWKAVIVDGQVTQWHVFADNEPIRALIRKHAAAPEKSGARGKKKTRSRARPKSRARKKS